MGVSMVYGQANTHQYDLWTDENGNVIIKTNVLLPQAQVNYVCALWFSSSQKCLNYLDIQYFGFEHT